MIARSARTVITSSLIEIRRHDPEQTLTNTHATVGLERLKMLIDSANARQSLIYGVTRQEFTLTANQASRTLGPTGNFVVAEKPPLFATAKIVPVGATHEIDLDVWDERRWLDEPQKTQTGSYPHAVFPNPTHPNWTLQLWPVPTTAATLVLGWRTPSSSFVDLNTEYGFPPGYYEWIMLELAERLASVFGADWTQRQEWRLRELREAYRTTNDPGAAPLRCGDWDRGGRDSSDVDRRVPSPNP